MSLPPYLISVGAFVCERTLIERDFVVSAIRIIDLIYIPEFPVASMENTFPVVQASCCVIFKSIPGHNKQHRVELKLLDTTGELQDLGDPMEVNLESKIEGLPSGATIAAQLNFGAKLLGTYYLCIYLDQEEVARTPFTLMRGPSGAKG